MEVVTEMVGRTLAASAPERKIEWRVRHGGPPMTAMICSVNPPDLSTPMICLAPGRARYWLRRFRRQASRPPAPAPEER